MSSNQIIGAIKIKDGLFIGDEFAAQDLDFIVTNKVTHILNCAGQQISNQWLTGGIQYLTFNWVESDNEVLFDEKDENITTIFAFMENCFNLGESCLVHSVRGQSRSCCVLAAYFMKKYSWRLYKALEFLNSRRPDLEIRASFFYQLTSLEVKLGKTNKKLTTSWNELNDEDPNSLQVKEEFIIRNTFLNSHNEAVDEIYTNMQTKMIILQKVTIQKIQWRDQNNKENLNLATVVYCGSPDFLPIIDKNLPQKKQYISILKGSQNKLFQVQADNNQKRVNTLQSGSVSTQPTSQIRSTSNKSLGDQERILTDYSKDSSQPVTTHQHQPSNSSFSQSSYQQLSNNTSFNNLLVSCSMKLQQSQHSKKDSNSVVIANTIKQQPVQNITSKPTMHRPQHQTLINNLMKPPLQTAFQPKKLPNTTFSDPKQLISEESNEFNMLRSSSLQKFEDKRNNQTDRTNSVKDKIGTSTFEEQSKSILNSFQDFKNQVQMSLNQFNNKDQQIKSETINQLRLSLQPEQLDKPHKNPQQKQLDQLISPSTMIKQQINSSASFSNFQKTKDFPNSSILLESNSQPGGVSNPQSNFQKFQELQQFNDQKSLQNQYSVNLVNKSKDLLKTSFEQSLRSNSVPKKPIDDTNQMACKRPSSAEQQKLQLQDYSKQIPKKASDSRKEIKKDPSPSNLKQRKIPNQSTYGPPIPQSTSHLYLRNVQTRRQATSTLRNQRPINSTFQDRFMNQNHSNFSNLSQTNLQNQNSSYTNSYGNDNSKYLDKQVEMLNQNRGNLIKSFNDGLVDFNQLKKTISPTQQFANSKSQTSFQKNQPVKATMEVNEKLSFQCQQTMPITQGKPRDIKDKDPNANSSLINMNVSFKQPRQFSPALKSEVNHKLMNYQQKLNINQNIRHKFRSSSPGNSNQVLQATSHKENDVSNGFQSNSYLGVQHKQKSSWKIL